MLNVMHYPMETLVLLNVMHYPMETLVLLNVMHYPMETLVLLNVMHYPMETLVLLNVMHYPMETLVCVVVCVSTIFVLLYFQFILFYSHVLIALGSPSVPGINVAVLIQSQAQFNQHKNLT